MQLENAALLVTFHLIGQKFRNLNLLKLFVWVDHVTILRTGALRFSAPALNIKSPLMLLATPFVKNN